jgi:hypothetical protein
LLAAATLLIGCTDHLDVTGLPTSCKDQAGKDVGVRVEMRVSQAGDLRAVDTVSVSKSGDADLMIGADTQSKSLLRPGHRPAQPELNAIYTADPVSIELRLKGPCQMEVKKTTVVLDDLPHHKAKGHIRYVLQYDQLKS